MQKNEIIVFEYLDFKTINLLIFDNKFKKKNRVIYYIYSNNLYFNIINLFGKILMTAFYI